MLTHLRTVDGGASSRALKQAPTGVLQRKCACGNHTLAGGQCAACNKKGLSAQRQVVDKQSEHTEIPPIVNEVLRSPGKPLDGETRAFMEPRFGHDFSGVRVHTDTKAAESARAVDALAYTVGRDIVLGSSHAVSNTRPGRELIAHELAHVVQQSNVSAAGPVERMSSPGDVSEGAADVAGEGALRGIAPSGLGGTFSGGTLFRRVGSLNCPPNVFGAPADPRAALETIDSLAVSLANQAADGLATDAEDVKGGIPVSPSVTFQSYQDHFGLPSAVGKAFLNRLTGVVRPSQEVAMREELQILSRRFRLIGRLFSGTVGYRCPGNAAVTLPGCAAGSCGPNFAFSCRGGGSIALCDPFWSQLGSDEARAAALIHEATHMILGPAGLSAPGEIGETTQRGPGRNFNIAGCYEFIIDDMAGVNSLPVCPAVPAPPNFA